PGIFDAEPFQKVQINDDIYNVFAIESKHLEQPESVNDTYLIKQDEDNIIIDSLDMSYDREHVNHDDDDDLAKEPRMENDNLNARTSNVNFVYVTCGKCVLNENHDMCVLHYINGVNSRTKMPMSVPISTREHKRTVNQSVATPFKRTVASESTNKKPRHTTRKLYEHVSKTCSWWYPMFAPSGYEWKPKSPIGNVNTNFSMPLGNASRTVNILECMTPRCSTMFNTALYSNSFAARSDNSIHH
nr:hypothetical protein [Tanacetum cinerariifolium]